MAIMKHHQFTLALLLLSALLALASSAPLRPIYAGTLELEDKILRLNTCIFKNLTLPFTKSEYEAFSNVGVIATISELSMDQHYAYQFRYEIICPSNCFIDFTLSRFTQTVSEDFQYRLVIDFLVAEEVVAVDFNMTSHKMDLSIPQFKSLRGMGEIETVRAEDWEMFLIPNGYNNASMTGHITHKALQHSSKYLLTFSEGTGEDSFVRWPLNQNFILFKALFIPKADLNTNSPSDCKGSPFFSGLLATSESEIHINLHTQLVKGNFQPLQLPLTCSSSFSDARKPIESISVQTSRDNEPMSIIYFIFPFLVAELAYTLYKKQRRAENKEVVLPEMMISFESSHVSAVKMEELTSESEREDIP